MTISTHSCHQPSVTSGPLEILGSFDIDPEREVARALGVGVGRRLHDFVSEPRLVRR